MILTVFGQSVGTANAETVSDIKSDETVIFFPALAYPTEDADTWEVKVHGWIYEASFAGEAAVRSFQAAMDLSENLDAESKTILRKRARYLVVDNERSKQIVIRLGDKSYPLEESTANGHFVSRFQLSSDEINRHKTANGIIPFEAVMRNGDSREFKGDIHRLSTTGISVISDIDDTIKISEITDKRAALANAFWKPFRPIPGMAKLYNHWTEKHADIRFHYVSAGAWQVYAPLEQFRGEAGFPPGTYHMRNFRWKDRSFFEMLDSPVGYKRKVIESLIAVSGRRRFVLVGDSGQSDPEVYADIARRYPNRILRIYIRDVTNQRPDAVRYQRTFRGVSAGKWTIFRDASEIDPALPRVSG